MIEDGRKFTDDVGADLAQRLVEHDGSMLIRHVVLCEVMTAEGERVALVAPSADVQLWDLYGLLAHAQHEVPRMYGRPA